MLEFGDVIDYLLTRGVLDAKRVVSEGVVVRDVSSRHRNFKVELPNGHGFHLKQGGGPETHAALMREAAVYRNITKNDPSLAGKMPQYRDYDEQQGVLILHLLPRAEDLHSLALRLRESPPTIGAATGQILGILHRSKSESRVIGTVPPFFYLYRPNVEIFRDASAANLDLIRIVQSSKDLCQRLDSVRDELRCEALLHNDIKWSNFLYSEGAVRLVDWEAADYGDPAWDLGCMFAQYLSCWVFSIPASGGTPASDLAALATLPLASMFASVNAMCTAYLDECARSNAAVPTLFSRAVRLSAVRLLQTAYESSQFAPRLTSNEILLIQLASNILERPNEAARHLLGLTI